MGFRIFGGSQNEKLPLQYRIRIIHSGEGYTHCRPCARGFLDQGCEGMS